MQHACLQFNQKHQTGIQKVQPYRHDDHWLVVKQLEKKKKVKTQTTAGSKASEAMNELWSRREAEYEIGSAHVKIMFFLLLFVLCFFNH